MVMRKTPLTWPLTPLGQVMTTQAIKDELQHTISEINSRTDSPVFILQPNPEDITIDRQHATITANCEWYSKQELRKTLNEHH